MKIIFDFDHAIFDMTSMHQEIERNMGRIGIQQDDYRKAYEDVTRWKLFTVNSLANRLYKLHELDTEKTLKVFSNTVEQADLFVYEDVYDTLNKLKSEGHELYLFAWGDSNWQRTKVNNTGLVQHFKEVVCDSYHRPEFIDKLNLNPTDVLAVVNKPVVGQILSEKYPGCKILRLRRKNAKYSDIDSPMGIPEITNMREVIEHIKTL